MGASETQSTEPQQGLAMEGMKGMTMACLVVTDIGEERVATKVARSLVVTKVAYLVVTDIGDRGGGSEGVVHARVRS